MVGGPDVGMPVGVWPRTQSPGPSPAGHGDWVVVALCPALPRAIALPMMTPIVLVFADMRWRRRLWIGIRTTANPTMVVAIAGMVLRQMAPMQVPSASAKSMYAAGTMP